MNLLSNIVTSPEHQPKHYTINDIKFDPTRQATPFFYIFQHFNIICSKSFASIGEDKICRFWGLDTESEESKWKLTVHFPYAFVPHVLAFRPGSGILAVAVKWGLNQI
jgi:hypothetical protein